MRLGILLIVCLLFCQVFLFGTDYLDVIYLKNGDVVKGRIVKDVPNYYVKVEIPSGTTLFIEYSEIEKIEMFAREKIETSTKTNKLSIKTKTRFKGIKAGINMGKFRGSDADLDTGIDPKYILGFTIGGFSSSNGAFYELLFTRKGSKYEESGVTETVEMNYLDFNFGLIVPVQNNINLTFGGLIGFYLGGKVTVEYDGESYSEDIDKDVVKSTDKEFFLGVLYDISPNIGTEIRYCFGFASWYIPDDPFDFYGDIKHSSFQLTVNYSL